MPMQRSFKKPCGEYIVEIGYTEGTPTTTNTLTVRVSKPSSTPNAASWEFKSSSPIAELQQERLRNLDDLFTALEFGLSTRYRTSSIVEAERRGSKDIDGQISTYYQRSFSPRALAEQGQPNSPTIKFDEESEKLSISFNCLGERVDWNLKLQQSETIVSKSDTQASPNGNGALHLIQARVEAYEKKQSELAQEMGAMVSRLNALEAAVRILQFEEQHEAFWTEISPNYERDLSFSRGNRCAVKLRGPLVQLFAATPLPLDRRARFALRVEGINSSRGTEGMVVGVGVGVGYKSNLRMGFGSNSNSSVSIGFESRGWWALELTTGDLVSSAGSRRASGLLAKSVQKSALGDVIEVLFNGLTNEITYSVNGVQVPLITRLSLTPTELEDLRPFVTLEHEKQSVVLL